MLINGASYVFTHEKIGFLIGAAGLIGLCGYSFRAMLPVVAGDVLHGGPEVLSRLTAATGIGAFIGTLIVSVLRNIPLRTSIPIAVGLNGIACFLFPVFHQSGLMLLALFAGGMGFTITNTVIRTAAQVVTEPRMRGRVMGIFIMVFFGGIGAGSFLTGILARHIGVMPAIQVNGIVLVICAGILATMRKIIPEA